jgi:hypothetical protein
VRCQNDPELDPTTLGELTQILQEVNPYIDIYKTAREQLVTGESHTDHVSLTANMELVMPQGAGSRRESLPTADEVAVIVPDVRPGIRPTQDLRLMLRADPDGYPMQRVSMCHESYLPLHYVLLFPHGDPGWHDKLLLTDTGRDRQRTRLTLRAFHAYRLFPCLNEFDHLFRGERLFQQYMVDAAATIE